MRVGQRDLAFYQVQSVSSLVRFIWEVKIAALETAERFRSLRATRGCRISIHEIFFRCSYVSFLTVFGNH